MKALEKRADVRAAAADWQKAFRESAEVIGTMSGRDVLWHEAVGLWAAFGTAHGKGGAERDWNAFGQKPSDFRSNIVVEINPPRQGVDQNLQGVFAVDDDGRRWVLHQGRMSVTGSRVTEADFVAATGLIPIEVRFDAGPAGEYHKVAPIDAAPIVLRTAIAEFVSRCAIARLAKTAPRTAIAEMTRIDAWERGLNPEATGSFQAPARDAATGRRLHGEVWKALSAELTGRTVPHSNDRFGRYGPDLFTYGDGPKVLFEIKSGTSPGDVFGAVGQLQIYEQLMKARYRKVLVSPAGMAAPLRACLSALRIAVLEFRREGRRIRFDEGALDACLASDRSPELADGEPGRSRR